MRWRNLSRRYSDRVSALSAMTPHELFGIKVDANPEVIKAAYTRMVKAYHPDVADPFMARHNQEVMKLINVAYARLKEER